MSQGHHERSPRWAPFEGDPSHKQVHALEFIAESLDRIEGHLPSDTRTAWYQTVMGAAA